LNLSIKIVRVVHCYQARFINAFKHWMHVVNWTNISLTELHRLMNKKIIIIRKMALVICSPGNYLLFIRHEIVPQVAEL
jgi:hypothetical protein